MCQEGKNSWLDHQMFLMDFPGIKKEPNFPQVETMKRVPANQCGYYPCPKTSLFHCLCVYYMWLYRMKEITSKNIR